MQPDNIRPAARIQNDTFSDGIFTSNRRPRGCSTPRRFTAVSLKSAEISSAWTAVLHCKMVAVSFLPLSANPHGFRPIPARRDTRTLPQKQKNAGNAGVLIGV